MSSLKLKMSVCFKHRPPLIHGNMQSNQHGGVLPPPPKTMRAHQPPRHTSSFEGQTAQQPQQLIIQVLMFFSQWNHFQKQYCICIVN